MSENTGLSEEDTGASGRDTGVSGENTGVSGGNAGVPSWSALGLVRRLFLCILGAVCCPGHTGKEQGRPQWT